MNSRIYMVLFLAGLVSFTSAAQNTQRNSGGFVFNDNEIEGSGFNGDGLTRDLESSGSGQGPSEDDDEDLDSMSDPDRSKPNQPPPVVDVIPRKTDISPDQNTPINPNKNKDTVSITEDTGVIMNPKSEDPPTSFFSQPGILAAVIGGAVVGLLCAILVVMFIVYRMRKKDEGSYALGEPKQSPNSNSYSRGTNKEFYA
ncbi:syndecan [Anthonomus grandis grandis]|uniref:syndecan n=1 Tax=Anthonomus grandis grandis TaxID=2921223 RepID=UPI0021654E2D|nr:syndecan [Anthonomus grandis grandis]